MNCRTGAIPPQQRRGGRIKKSSRSILIEAAGLVLFVFNQIFLISTPPARQGCFATFSYCGVPSSAEEGTAPVLQLIRYFPKCCQPFGTRIDSDSPRRSRI